VALGLFVLLATAAATAWAYARGRAAVLAEARAELDSRARLSADRLERAIGERARLAALWPGLSTSQDLAVDDVDKRVALSLEELASHVGGGSLALALDTTGTVVAASSAAWIGRRVSGEKFYQRGPVADGGAAVASIPGDVPLLAVTSVVLSAVDGAPLGRIVLLSPWTALVAEGADGDAGALSVRDQAGRALFRGRLFLRADSSTLLVSRSTAHAPDAPPLEVAVAMPEADALRPLRRTTRSLLLFAVVVLAVTLPAAVLLARSTTAELRRLTERAREAERTGRADFGAPSPAAPAEVRVLAGALQSMEERLEASRAELARQESLAAMGTMAAGLAHEVRTPLSVIRGSAEMLARHAAAGSQDAELAAFVVEEADRLSRLVDDLLAFARPREPVRERADLAAVARRVAGAPGIGGGAVGIETRLEPAPVTGDAEQLYQVALNLAANAIQASPPGASVLIRTGVDGADAVLEVADGGPGITPEDLPKVWTPFFSQRVGGTGLGLPIVRRIVEAHDGTVVLESGSGDGTKAVVRLPLRTESRAP
jgi:two-component system, NtrC family, sensor histidine kinase HydH